MYQTFVPGVDPPEKPTEHSICFAFVGGRLLLPDSDESGAARLPSLDDLGQARLEVIARHYLGAFGGRDCYALQLADDAVAPRSMTFTGLRSVYAILGEQLFALAGRAFQIIEWAATHRFCGRCGTPTVPVGGERATRCPGCGLTNYPRVSPAVIVLVRRDDRVLLARANNFPSAFYSTIAGFVEPGETLEETVEREIAEEVGVSVKNIRYFGSQPWPFPHSLMVGFTAEYSGGEIAVDGHEIADAGWFSADDLPAIPPPLSIARRLIDSFLGEDSVADMDGR